MGGSAQPKQGLVLTRIIGNFEILNLRDGSGSLVNGER